MSTPVASSRQEKSGSRRECGSDFGVLAYLKSGLGNFKEDRRGDVAMMFGLMAIIMLMSVGGAVDFGRWLHASKKTKTAVDAAVLAGGRILQVEGTTASAIENAKAAAAAYYKENIKSRSSDVYNDTVAFDVTPDKIAFMASGNAHIKTPILALANIHSMPLMKSTSADYSVAKLKSGGNASSSVEISMMLDTSGSMSGSKITDMKLAAKDLVDIVVWDNQSSHTSKVAIAPFSADVILPGSMNTPARGDPVSSKLKTYSCSTGTCTLEYKKTPCVAERTGSEKYTDAAPGVDKYVMTRYTTTSSCSQTSANAVVPLSNDKVKLKNSIDGLVLGGGTAGHLGTAWAWYTLSPNWGSVMGSGSQPAAYGGVKKIAILMTDGEYNEEYTVDGIATGARGAGSTPANGSSVVQAKALCDGMKAKGIKVYTVGFALGGNQTAINTLTYCATDASSFYNANDGSQLRQAFRDIALKISDLYLSQ